MTQGKVHVAGSPKDGLQRCTRCHTLLEKHPLGQAEQFGWWRVGAEIYSHRTGMGITPSTRLEYRPCGRREGK